ncbi:serine protease [Pseudoruegeria sp. SK021]|uniref:trypsin-like serine peptidase n=1 Tax=Pseudoruegeria sp. SK021 TaxID=1933035 RepID=UPI000A219FDD|nr:trypsin-like peptidase domain-containing protein [Pseudoruegeria sp. SK021]OSP56563.1 hypothetical protein BV911_00950 [Pseudoruegeria sp. SK021]
MRIRYSLLGLLGLCLVGSITPASAQDPRRMLSFDEQQGWLAVGRLNVIGQGYCTATLVAQDVVLTAAHCLVDRRTGLPVGADRVHFLPGFRTGTYAAHGRGAEIAVPTSFNRADLTVASDIALVRLTEPLDPGIVPLQIAFAVSPGQALTTLSYGINRSQIPSIEAGCVPEQLYGALVYTDCEAVPGVSGAPVLQQTLDGMRLVAVASAVLGDKPQPMPHGKLLAVAMTRHMLITLSQTFDLEILITGLTSQD